SSLSMRFARSRNSARIESRSSWVAGVRPSSCARKRPAARPRSSTAPCARDRVSCPTDTVRCTASRRVACTCSCGVLRAAIAGRAVFHTFRRMPGASAAIHLKPATELAERVLLPGDPHRALAVAQVLLEQPKMFNHHRGLWGYTGEARDGGLLTIQSTG